MITFIIASDLSDEFEVGGEGEQGEEEQEDTVL